MWDFFCPDSWGLGMQCRGESRRVACKLLPVRKPEATTRANKQGTQSGKHLSFPTGGPPSRWRLATGSEGGGHRGRCGSVWSCVELGEEGRCRT